MTRVDHHLPGLMLYQLRYWYSVLPLVTLVKFKSWKVMMDAHRDLQEGIFSSLGLIVSWLLAVTNSITFHVFISTGREFVLVRGCNIMHKTILSESMSPAAAIPLTLQQEVHVYIHACLCYVIC